MRKSAKIIDPRINRSILKTYILIEAKMKARFYENIRFKKDLELILTIRNEKIYKEILGP
jgi:hypothetical protein